MMIQEARDTRSESPGFRKPARRVVPMDRNRGGRPSKGPRVYVNSPVSPAAHELLERYYELTKVGKGPTLARIFEAHIAELRREVEHLEAKQDESEGQNRIDLGDLRQSA